MSKALIILVGECFREGGQHSRLRDTNFSFLTQKEATNSHIDFFKHLKNEYNLDLDIRLLSYKTKFSKEFEDWYEQSGFKLTDSAYSDQMYKGGITEYTNNYIKNVVIEEYDFIFVFRPDLYLKKYFIEIFNPNWQEIRYPFKIHLKNEWTRNKLPNISDTMIFIPKKLFSIIKNFGIKLYHYGLNDYVHHHRVLKSDILCMIKTLHDSNSVKEYNPLYRMVSRKESRCWNCYGYETEDIYGPTLRTNKEFKFDDWSVYETIKSKNIINQSNVWKWWHKEKNHLDKFISLIELTDEGIEEKTIFLINLSWCKDQTYWKKEEDKIIIFNDKKEISSILYKIKEGLFSGKFLFKEDVIFTIEKLSNDKNEIDLKKTKSISDEVNDWWQSTNLKKMKQML